MADENFGIVVEIDPRPALAGTTQVDRALEKNEQSARDFEREAKAASMPYVNNRWLGGTLTNFRTIRERLKRLEELELLLDLVLLTGVSVDDVPAIHEVP